MLQFQPI